MKRIRSNSGFWILLFLSLFGLSIGVFDNYRDLWLSSNGISTLTISHIESISSLVTVLALFYFTLRIPVNRLKKGMIFVLILKMMVEVLLILLSNTGYLFAIKFLMFFDIAFTQLILSSTYPLMMNFAKNDELYSKKSFAESFFDKIGFLFVSIMVGKAIFGYTINYNTCLLFSLLFTFLSFIILVSLEMDQHKKKSSSYLDLKKTINYFLNNKIFIFFLGFNLLSETVWASILGMPMLTLTENLNIDSQLASFLILGLGIVSNILSIVILKYFRFKNDQINLLFKFGIRVILYALVFFTGKPEMLIATIVYMLITNSTHSFIFSSFFLNKIDEEYSLILTTLKYCSALIGKAIGIFICGAIFDLSIMVIALPAMILGVIQYTLGIILVEKKKAL